MLASYTHNVHVSITALAGFCGTRSAQGGREGGSKCTATTLLLGKLCSYKYCSTMIMCLRMLFRPFMAQLQNH